MSKHSLSPNEIQACLARPGMRVAQAMDVFCIGKNKIYEAMNTGQVKYRKRGKDTILDTASCLKVFGPNEAAE